MRFDLQPEDRVIPAGMRLGLMIFSSDSAFTVHPRPGTNLTLDLDETSATLPLVGGAQSLVWRK
jgi:X-Pro dipeptidyl-peptidase